MLLALKTLEEAGPPAAQHFSASADQLEFLVRIARALWTESWIFDFQKLDNRAFVESQLNGPYVEKMFSKVRMEVRMARRSAQQDRRVLRPNRLRSAIPHSYHIVVVDGEGNAVTGTQTIQSLAWGEGIFVEGIPLTAGGMLPFGSQPGERRLSPFTMHMVFKDGRLRLASGTFAASFVEASFQFLVNLIDYKRAATQIANLPRFGTFPYDITARNVSTTLDWTSNWLDPQIDPRIVEVLKARGLSFQRQGALLDTGCGVVVVVNSDGTLEGDIAPLPGLTTPFPQAAKSGPTTSRQRVKQKTSIGKSLTPRTLRESTNDGRTTRIDLGSWLHGSLSWDPLPVFGK